MITAVFLWAHAHGQSAYFQAITNLNPVAYWPLQEATQPPRYDVETNYGSFGAMANAYYASTNCVHGVAGGIAGDSDTAVNFNGTSSFALVPTTDNRVSLPAGQPFTVECWARATGSQSFVAIVNQQGAPNNAGGLNGSTNSSGWALCQNFATYRGTSSGNNPPCFSFHVFNGVGFTGGAEAEVVNNNASSWLNASASGYVNSWVYLVGVFDGTNCWMYMYSTNLDNTDYGGTTLMNLQLPITTAANAPLGGPGTTIPGATFSPDTWDPIQFAATRGYTANPYHGWVDEVAIYTNVLTSQQISNHFTAGTNGLGNYSATILADNPAMYWRMDAPKWTYPALNTLPPVTNYGSAGSSTTNLNTGGHGAACGVYQPGTVPGVPGPSYVGFGNMTNACAFNGLVGAADVGYNSIFDPVDVTNNFTLVAWFKGNPMDYNNNRWNAFASHSDKSWKAQCRGGTVFGFKGAGGQASIAPATFNFNDGKWHMYVLESTYTNGVSTNTTIYLDGGRFSATAANTSVIPGNPGIDAWLGGAPDSTYVEPTNESTYNGNQQYFAGEVAHVAYFSNALSLSQIQNLFFTAEPVPSVLTQPISASVDQNGAFTNSVVAVGEPPLSYQWYRNNAPVANQTNASLVLNPVQLSDQSANYYVVITNSFGSATSAVVSLTVISNLAFVGQFPMSYTNPITLYGGQIVGGTNYVGSSPTFSVSAMGALPISYQWRTNGVAVSGATSPSFTFENLQMGGPTTFDCVLGNSYGSLTSKVWSVSYLAAPTAPFPQAVLADQPVGYWRLNEPDDQAYDGNPGAICNDYQSGNNGTYTNVYLGNILGNTGYSPTTDPTEGAAQFGAAASSGCFSGAIGTNIDFSGLTNAEFTVAVWANSLTIPQPGNAGLVTKGYFSGEEFTLDEGSALAAQGLRFSVRDATGAAHDAGSAIRLSSDSYWHLVIGVCDQANSNVTIYVDGIRATNAVIPAGIGVFNASAVPIMIGARSSSAGTPGNNQFKGLLNDAAIFNYAMTAAQVTALNASAGVAPFFEQQPVSGTNVNQGSTLIIPTTPAGSAPLSFQWYDSNAGNSPMPGQTNTTLVVSNIQVSDSYYLVVTNSFGSADSTSVSVNVVSGAPQIFTDVTSPFYGFPAGKATDSVTAYGTAPLTYQWQFSNSVGWVSLADNSRISGSHSNFLTISNIQPGDAGNYQVVVANTNGSTTSSVAALVIPGVLPLTFGNGLAWTQNGSARFANGAVTLTDTSVGGDGSFFFQAPQYVGAFMASFTYQVGGNMAADGTTFCIQNDSRGAAASGSGGGALGYSGITPSAALELNIYSGNGVGGVGYSFNANGTIGPTTPPGNVVLNNGDPIDITVYYANGQIALTFTDSVAATSFSTNLAVPDLVQTLGTSNAYVGFTGAYGGSTSIQTVSNFKFVSIPSQVLRLGNATNATISWPGSILGYTLQQNPDLGTTNWLNVTNQNIVSNGLNQVTVPKGGSNQFYRLILQQ